MFGSGYTGLQFFGSSGRDVVFGSRLGDLIEGRDGNDILFGRRGDDIVDGGAGRDVLFGGSGEDVLFGGKGNDLVFGGSGDDMSVWNNGDGSDLVFGGSGYDTQVVNGAAEEGDAFRIANVGRLVTFERENLGEFKLKLFSTEALEVNSGGGDDRVALDGNVFKRIDISLDGGSDTADAAAATDAGDIATGDTLDLSHAKEAARVDLDANNQGVLQAPTNGGLTEDGFAEFGDHRVTVTDFENVIGTNYDDTIFGNAQNNVLIGGKGDDALHPFGGEDFVDGGEGEDVLLLNGFANGQFVDVAAGVAGDLNEARDGIADAAALNHFVNIENINGSSVAGDVILGDDGANVLSGLGGNDVLVGGAGDDVLNGGTGENDVMTGGAGYDSFVFANGDGNGAANNADEITDFDTEEDLLLLTAESFGLAPGSEVVFSNVARNDDGVDPNGIDDTLELTSFNEVGNVYVLQGAFANAGAARDAIAEARVDAQGGVATDEDEAGFFIYFNQAQGRNRLFAVEDLDQVGGSIQQVANFGGLVPLEEGGLNADSDLRLDALAQLETFEADNFAF